MKTWKSWTSALGHLCPQVYIDMCMDFSLIHFRFATASTSVFLSRAKPHPLPQFTRVQGSEPHPPSLVAVHMAKAQSPTHPAGLQSIWPRLRAPPTHSGCSPYSQGSEPHPPGLVAVHIMAKAQSPTHPQFCK